MALANCKSCGRLFDNIQRDICRDCMREEDEKFKIVRDYLKEHRRATLVEVSEATEVEQILIIRFIREGRLAVQDNPNLNFPCEACGDPIQDGRFCKPCMDRLKKDLSQTKTELETTRQTTSTRDYFYKRER